jgi:hypothetical protein
MARSTILRLGLFSLCAGLMVAGILLDAGCDPNRTLATYTCGDGICDSGEDPTTCPEDCQANTCGNNVCEVGEDGTTCAEDCAPTTCGDGVCDAPTENPDKCAADCDWATCGNGVCEAGEINSCVDDCFADLCGNGICDYSESPTDCPADCSAAVNVDILFVIDNSGSMAGEQMQLRSQFPALYQTLRSAVGALPDLHVGVTSTDLGTGGFQITYCEDEGGDGGDLLANPSAGLTGANWMIDRTPEGCNITRQTDGTCTANDCDVSHCPEDGTAPLQLVTDAVNGCPRCRNFAQTADQTFAALGDLGTMGCGFEQPMEAMYKALDGNPANNGFIRPDAMLAVIFITDEDDCSASTDQLFDNTQTGIDSTLGPLTSFRCFEFGIVCDINTRTHEGTRHDCVPREDAAALLHPISRYRDLLYSLKDPGELSMAMVAGTTVPSPLSGFEATVGVDDMNQPSLQFSCTTSDSGATPAIRIMSLLEQFMHPEDIGAYANTSICSADYTPTLAGLGDYIRSRLGE